MPNSFYNHSTYPTPNAPGSSAQLRAELDLITAGFNKLPTLSGNGYKVAMVNSAGTALIASSALQQLALTQSTIDSTPIGATTRAAGNFTTLSANSTVNLGSAVTIAGGTINNTIIGGTTPAAAYFTTVEADSMDVGSLIAGGFEGDLVGNVTGDVTGNLAGNVTTSTGTSTFNNVTINGTLDMSSGTVGTITGLATPSNSSDATPKSYVDTQVATRLALAGGTMSGAIAMGTNRITGMGDPSNAQDAATKAYTDTQRDTRLALAGGTMSGVIAMGSNKITGLADPTQNQDAATKAYVDSVAQGLDIKASVRAATTANITLSGTATVDGVALSVGDRVLVKDQTTASENGIWVVASGGWGRASDMDAWAELPGAFVFVEDGSTNDNSGWVCTVAPGGTIGTTAVTFEQFSGAGQITAGAGMSKSGNTLNVGTASTGRIVVNANDIDLATTGVTAGTYKSVTVDSYGRVTAGTNPTTLAGYGITDAYTTTQVDTALALKLNLSGGTMSGNIAMGSNRVTGLGAPSGANDAATKTYVDTADALKLSLSGGTMSGAIAMGGSKITGLGDPTSNQDAVTLSYVTTLYGSTASAAASASAAATSATNAANSATAASGSATSAANSASAAAASYDSFDDRYLGSKTSDPTVDNDGNALLTGALYWNSSLSLMKAYDGAAWQIAYVPSNFYLPLTGGTLTGPTVLNVNSSSDALRITQVGSGNALYIEDVATDATPFVVSSTGAVGIGTTTPDNVTSAGIALVSNNGYYPQVVNRNRSNDDTASYLVFDKDRAGSIVQSGDALGAIVWRSFDGTNYLQSSAIIGYSDGTPGTNDVPGSLVFFTTADGASSPAERLRINRDGNVGIGTSSPVARIHTEIPAATNSSVEMMRLTDGTYCDFKVLLNRATTLGGSLSRLNTASGNMAFEVSNTERMRIVGSELIIGGTSTGYGVGSTRQTNVASSTGIVTGLVLQNSANNPSGQGVALYFKNSIYNGGGIEDAKAAYIKYYSAGNYSEQGNLAFGTNNGFGVGPIDRMLLGYGGNLYVGPNSTNWSGAAGITLGTNSTSLDSRNFVRINNRGNPGTTTSHTIGGIVWSAYRDVRDPSDVAAIWAIRTSYAGGLASDGTLVFGTDLTNGGSIEVDGGLPAERMRLTHEGNFFIGGTTGAGKLSVQGNGPSGYAAEIYNTVTNNNVLLVSGTSASNSQNKIVFSNGGSVCGTVTTTATTTSYNTSSDYRLKKDIQPMTGALAKVAALKPCTYKWKADGSDGEGFIAHELQAVVPQCVTGEKDAVDSEGKPVYQGIDTSFLVATLTAAIQEQQAIITALTARVAALESN